MCGRGKGGKGLGAWKKWEAEVSSDSDSEEEFICVSRGKRKLSIAESNEEGKEKIEKIRKKIARTKKTEEENMIEHEKEYTKRMSLPASEDKAWWGDGSREDIEKVLEKDYGDYRYNIGSKHCRMCFGYGVYKSGGQCEKCVCFCGGSKTYLGNDTFDVHCG